MIAKDARYHSSQTPFNEEIPSVLETRVGAMQSKQWKFTIGKKTIKVRDQVDKIVKMIQLFKEAAAAAAQADPIHAGLPWAGLCLVLPLLTNDSEQLAATMNGLEYIATLILRFNSVETHLRSPAASDKTLEKSIVHMFSLVLRYEASACCYMSRNTMTRFLRNIPKLDDWATIMKKLKEAEFNCNALLVDKNATDIRHALDDMYTQMSHLLQQARANDKSYETKVIKIMEKVSSGSVENTHITVLKTLGSAYVNSGQWLWSHAKYKAWASAASSCFWLRGSVGSGKTCLTAVSVEDLITRGENIAFFYCSRSNTAGNSNSLSLTAPGLSGSHCESILRSLLVQLCFRASGASQTNPLVERFDSDPVAFLDRQPTSEECEDDLIEIVEHNMMTYIIVDALDECSKPMDLLRSLRKVAAQCSKLRIFFTSRMHVPVQEEFDDAIVISITEQNSHDIEAYVNCELRDQEKLRRSPLKNDPELRDEVAAVLTSKAGSMFRWVELQLAVLVSRKLVGSVRASLESLRNDSHTANMDLLDKAYHELFELNTNSEEGMRHIAVTAFKWVMCSIVPLAPIALAAFVSVRSDGSVNQEITLPLVLDSTSNFLMINEGGFVQIAHVSALHFIEQAVDGPAVSLAESQQYAVDACLPSMMSPPLPTWHELATSWEIMNGMRKQARSDSSWYLFKVYATTYGFTHLQTLTPTQCKVGKLGSLLDQFLTTEGLAKFEAWFDIWTRFADQLVLLPWFHSLPSPDVLELRRLKTSLSSDNQHLVATALGLTSSTISAIKSAQQKPKRSGSTRRPTTPIRVETFQGPVLSRSRSGDRMRSRSTENLPLLGENAESSLLATIAPFEVEETPWPGHVEWPFYPVPHALDSIAKDICVSYIGQAIAGREYDLVYEHFLKPTTTISEKLCLYCLSLRIGSAFALSEPLWKLHPHEMLAMLDYLLHFGYVEGLVEVAKSLIREVGALSLINTHHLSFLHVYLNALNAQYYDLPAKVRLASRPMTLRLVDEYGAQFYGNDELGVHATSMPTGFPQPPVQSDAVSIVLALLEAGADPNAHEIEQRTPVHVAGLHGIAEVLLEHGADPNMKDSRGRTSLHYAVSKDVFCELYVCDKPRTHWCSAKSAHTVLALLCAGADPNIQDHDSKTALYAACEMGNEWRASLSFHPTSSCWTPGVCAISDKELWNYPSCCPISIMLFAGADPNLRANSGASPLLATRDIGAAYHLMMYGCDPTVEDKEGRSIANGDKRVYSFVRESMLYVPPVTPEVKEAEDRARDEAHVQQTRKQQLETLRTSGERISKMLEGAEPLPPPLKERKRAKSVSSRPGVTMDGLPQRARAWSHADMRRSRGSHKERPPPTAWPSIKYSLLVRK